MKKLIVVILTAWITIAPIFCQAQSLNGKITGKVIGMDKRPIEAATITLLRLQLSIRAKSKIELYNRTFAP